MNKPRWWWSPRRKHAWKAAQPAIEAGGFPILAPRSPDEFAALMARLVPGMSTRYLRLMEEVMNRPGGPSGLGRLQLAAIQQELVCRGERLRRRATAARDDDVGA